MNYLFLFTISPVQSFIAQSRKTNDLFSGSKLLSDLINVAINSLPDKNNCIFPHFDVPSKPNRFIAKIQNFNDEKINELGKSVERNVKKYFSDRANNLFIKIRKDGIKPLHFDKQIDSFLEIKWVAIEFEDSNYQNKFNEIENGIGSIKNLRNFDYFEEAGARKCSLCGERNALFCYTKKSMNQKDVIEFNNNVRFSFYLSKDEGLCAVCFTKRFSELNESFPSTAEIAIMSTITHLKSNLSNDSIGMIANYENLIVENGDYQLYFKDNLNNKYLDRQGLSVFKNKLPQLKKELEKIEKKARESKLKLSPYYALAMFDADSMGEWLSGKNLKSEKNLMDFHKILSKQLGEFGKWLVNYFAQKANSHKGKVVYAGGDDFLIFLNLNYLFSELEIIYNKFDSLINPFISQYSNNKSVTFSGGIVIAHYKHPLSDVLSNCRLTEKLAKSNDKLNKNSFALSVIKHSGEIEQITYKWKTDDKFLLNNLSKVIHYLKNDTFSKTFIENLQKEFYPLLVNDDYKDEPIIKTETKRLLKKSFKLKVKVEEKENIVSDMSENLTLLLSGNFENFLSSLRISEFIARHLNGGANENSN